MRYDPHRFIDMNTSPVGAAVRRGAALLDEVHHWGMDFKCLYHHPTLFSFLVFL